MPQPDIVLAPDRIAGTARHQEGFSLDADLIRSIFKHAKPLGHHESTGNLNLGFGFMYYGLVRTLRPKHIVVIGSGFGFSVVCLALALKDNGKGQLSFVDPSYSVLTDGPFKTVGGTAQWDEPGKVERLLRRRIDRIDGLLLSGAPPQIRMHHLALNRPGPHT